MTSKFVLAAALLIGFAGTALAADSFLILKDADKHCRVIEQKTVSQDQLSMQIGKQGYPTREEADVDVKVLCDTP
jgi:hypothetical protein